MHLAEEMYVFMCDFSFELLQHVYELCAGYSVLMML